MSQPLIWNQRFQHAVQVFQTFEISGKCPIKLIEILLVFNQAGSAEKIKIIDIGIDEPLFQSFQQIHQLPQGYRNVVLPQCHEKINQHDESILGYPCDS